MPADPCGEAARLRELRTALVSGQSESLVRFDLKEVRFYKADLGALDRLIAENDRNCAVSRGETPARTRFAKRMRFAPY